MSVTTTNDVPPLLIPALLAKRQDSLEVQQHDELAALMRKHTEQRQAITAVPPTPTLSTRAGTSKREVQLTANYEFLLRSL